LNYSKLFIGEILQEVKTIAIVGASPRQERDSFKVMRSLIDNGYEVFPVNPNEEGNLILGQFCYKDLSSIQKKIDMVDVFRAEEAIMGITKESIQIKAKVLWTQLGIVNEEASKLAKKAGLKVVMNRCPKIELDKLDSKKIALNKF
jgi:predicted CoA-binding protein